jgi:hypothetical protein
MRVITEFVPLPQRFEECQWVAYAVEARHPYPQGYGATKEDALSDFYDKFDRIVARGAEE